MGFYINARSIHDMASESFSRHVNEIRNHWRRLNAKRKAIAKERANANKPPSKAYSFRYNPKGTPILTIRGRKPPYLYASEWKDLVSEYPEAKADLQSVLAKRKITVRPDGKKK